MKRTFAFALAALMAGGAGAQSVVLQGVMGTRALLIVDGGSPKAVSSGDSFQGVKVVSASGDQAVVEIAGRRHTLRVGEAPGSIGGTGAPVATRIMLTAGSGGHFFSDGAINGQAVRYVVDTGATSVSLGRADAERIGIDYKRGRPGLASTANGNVTVWMLRLASVRVGEVEIRDVEATVVPVDMPYVLLGNSFLNRFQMKRENDIMVLERRY